MAALSQKARPRDGIRVDLQLIAVMVEAGTRVLDVGCGDGALLDYLQRFKQVNGRGMESQMISRLEQQRGQPVVVRHDPVPAVPLVHFDNRPVNIGHVPRLGDSEESDSQRKSSNH